VKTPISVLLVASLVAAGAAALAFRDQRTPPARTSPSSSAPPPTLDDGWSTGSLEEAGINRERIEAMTESIRAHPEYNVHALLIEHDGRLVYEEYFTGKDERWGTPIGVVTFTGETKHDLRSVTKSVVSALVGIARRSGAIQSLDAPLLDYFPELKDLQVPERRQITIRHALMMGSGLQWHEDVPYNDPTNDEIVMTRSADPIRYVLSRPIVAAPGTVWRYNGGTTQVLGTIVQRATMQRLDEYARSVLFSPLGITDVEWVGDLAGVPSAASGLRLRPRDLAKFGSLYMHEGTWNRRQIIPADWVKESTQRRLNLPGQQVMGYGYQWWHACYRTPAGIIEVPTAVGNGMQRIFLLRDRRTVVTALVGLYNDFKLNPPERLLLEFILPALPPSTGSTCPS
jgi:CubicO group peptidase (beta-lactamase class C family)